jgi:hypothetical protein
VSQDRREINDFRWRVLGGGAGDKLIAFICECGDPDCHSTALLTVREYEQRTATDDAPIVYPGHRPLTDAEDAGGLLTG